MRKSDIAYVPNPPVFKPPENWKNMSVEEIVKKYIKTCGKADGLVSVCSRCQSPCEYGKRAVQLLANKVYNDPPIPLYAGKNMIEMAREENLRRRNQAEEKQKIEESKNMNEKRSGKDGRMYLEDWYSKAMGTDDPVKWIMDNFQISKKKAMQKIYGWRSRHPESKQETKEKEEENIVDNIAVKVKAEELQKVKDSTDERIEAKLESLIRQQEDQKKAMEECYKAYEQAKAEYEKIKLKVDTLCSAMDIMNEI